MLLHVESGMTVAVVGDGSVAHRKVRRLLDEGMYVHWYTTGRADASLAQRVEDSGGVLLGAYTPGVELHVDLVVFAAGDPELYADSLPNDSAAWVSIADSGSAEVQLTRPKVSFVASRPSAAGEIAVYSHRHAPAQSRSLAEGFARSIELAAQDELVSQAFADGAWPTADELFVQQIAQEIAHNLKRQEQTQP